jgi:hypothetical protein
MESKPGLLTILRKPVLCDRRAMFLGRGRQNRRNRGIEGLAK